MRETIYPIMDIFDLIPSEFSMIVGVCEFGMLYFSEISEYLSVIAPNDLRIRTAGLLDRRRPALLHALSHSSTLRSV